MREKVAVGVHDEAIIVDVNVLNSFDVEYCLIQVVIVARMGLLRVITSRLVSCFVLLVEIIRLGLFPDLLGLPGAGFVLVDAVLGSVLGKSLLLNEL